jgi:tetratricopeptide (TPR) repeat protein
MLEAFPDNVNLRLYQLSLLGELGRREQRLEILRSACRATLASSVLATRLVSELVDDARDYREAAQRLRRPLRFSQIDGRAIWLQGYLLWNQGERADALEFYRLAASVDETDEWHARSYFVASRYLHQSSQVLAWLEDRNRQFGERSSAPGQTLAWAYMQIDQIQRAFDLFDSTIDLHPEDGNLRCSVALQLGNFNRHTQAAEHLNAARNCVKQATFERTAAKLAKLQGRIGDARSLLKRPSAGAVRYGNVRGDTAT